MPEYKLHFQLHYMRRMVQRGFNDEQCQRVVNSPEIKIAQGPGERGGTVFRMQKTVDGKNLVVVAELIKKRCLLNNCFFQR